MDFCVLFMRALTVEETGKPTHHTVGRRSAYDVLGGCYPPLSRELHPRHGVSAFEMTKALRKAEFQTVKMRISSFSKRFPNVAATPANCHRYANRRWRNPDDHDDLSHISSVLPHLNRAISSNCSLETCLQALRHAVTVTDYNVKHRKFARPSLTDTESVLRDHGKQCALSPTSISPTSSYDADSRCDGACTSPNSSCEGLALEGNHVENLSKTKPSSETPMRECGVSWDTSQDCNDHSPSNWSNFWLTQEDIKDIVHGDDATWWYSL